MRWVVLKLRPVRNHLLLYGRISYAVNEERQASRLALLILGSRPTATEERCVLPRGILYECGRGRLCGFLGVIWVFSGLERKQAGESFISTFFFLFILEEQSHPV